MLELATVIPERWAVPASWRWKDLAEIGLIVGGGTPSTSERANFDANGVPWITPADLSGFTETYVAGGERALSSRGLATSGAKLLPPGSVLFSSRAPIGYCVIAANELATSQGFKSLVLNPAMCPEYVREYLIGSVEYAESHARGTTFKELSAAKFAKLRIPVPPPEEQVRIARRLKNVQRFLDQVQAEISQARIITNKLRAAILRSAFSGDLTRGWRHGRTLESSTELVARTPEVDQPTGGRNATDKVVEGGVALRLNGTGSTLPVGWSWQPLLRLARQETGHTPSRANATYWNGTIPWVGIKDASKYHGSVVNMTFQTITERGIENSSARLLPAGTVLLCRTAASIGYVCRLGRPMATSQDFVAWVCGPALNPTYLMYLLMGERDFLKRLGRGTAHPTIYLPEVRAFSIALPPLMEQNEIVACLDTQFERLAQVQKEIEAAYALTPNLSSQLHYQTFSGQLEPQDIEDGDVDIALSRHASELEMKTPTRRKRQSGEPKPKELTISQQLAERYDVWPESGYTFEDLRESFTGSYEEIKTAIFGALREKKLSQRFDSRRRMMTFIKGEK